MDAYERTVLGLKALAAGVGLTALVGGAAFLTGVGQPTPEVKVEKAPAVLETTPRWQDGQAHYLVPCESEDSFNCYWDATLRGNKVGQSFVNINGVMYYKSGAAE